MAELQHYSTITALRHNYSIKAELQHYGTITTLRHNYGITAQLQHYGTITALQLLLFDESRLQPITYDTVS